MVFQKPAHSGAYGELCSASEHVSYFSTGDNPGSISADGRRRKNRGSSNDEHLTWDGLISEDLRAGGPRLCTLPAEWRFITEDHPLYSRVTPDWDIAPKIFDICHRFNVLVEAVIFCTLQSVLQPESQPIFTAVIPAKKRDKNEDWVSLSREVLQFLHSEGIVGISVDIRDARAGEPDACFPIVESDAIFACWGKVLDSILDFCDTQDWSSVGCYRIGKDEKNWSQNPATVLVTVNKTASSRDWRPSREAIVAILDGFELPMVAVKIVGADIVCAASPTPPEFPNAEDLLESTVRVGKSVGRCQYEGESGTFGGWIELLDRETEQWRVFGLTCSHVALPDNVAGKVPKLYTDTNGGPRPQMDSPSQRDLDSRLCTLDKRSNDRTNNTEYIERQCKLETPGLSLTPLEQRYHDHDNAILSSIGQEKREIEAFKADHKHHLGSVVHASGTCRDVPSRTWADGSATSVDWALIDAPERCKTNMVSFMQSKKNPKLIWS